MSIAVERRRPSFGFHHRLVLARETAGLNQAQMAEVIDVSRPTVSSYENGLTRPRRLQVRAWALACGVDADWLENGETLKPGGPEGLSLPELDSNQQPAGTKPERGERGEREWIAPVIVLRPSVAQPVPDLPAASA